MIPRQASLTRLSQAFVGLEETGIVIPFANRDWQQSKSQPRRAMLNNFGAAGSNAALILEEHIESHPKKHAGCGRSSYIFNVSARTVPALQAYVKKYSNYVQTAQPRPHIKDVCYTATARRATYSHRISLVCTSIEDLEAKLNSVDASNIQPCQASKAVVFAFSGQGSIYRGMSEGLLDTSSFFRHEVQKCDKIVQDLGFPSFMSYFVKEDKDQKSLTVAEDIITSQCACVALEYCIAKLLLSWNIVPTCIYGHR